MLYGQRRPAVRGAVALVAARGEQEQASVLRLVILLAATNLD